MNKEFLKKLFEQSFLIVCLVCLTLFLVSEYKKQKDKQEKILFERVKELNKKNEQLYERLIDCNK